MAVDRSDSRTVTSSRRLLLVLAVLPALVGVALVLWLILFGKENQLLPV